MKKLILSIIIAFFFIAISIIACLSYIALTDHAKAKELYRESKGTLEYLQSINPFR